MFDETRYACPPMAERSAAEASDSWQGSPPCPALVNIMSPRKQAAFSPCSFPDVESLRRPSVNGVPGIGLTARPHRRWSGIFHQFLQPWTGASVSPSNAAATCCPPKARSRLSGPYESCDIWPRRSHVRRSRQRPALGNCQARDPAPPDPWAKSQGRQCVFACFRPARG